MRIHTLLILGVLISPSLVGSLKFSQTCAGYDCLKGYVDTPEPAYKWEDTGHRVTVEDYLGRGGWTGYYLNFTSQHWLTPEITSRYEWWHIMVVIVPKHLDVSDTALLWMTGGKNNEDFQPDLSDENLLIVADMATSSRMICAALFHIPNQPILYAEDPLQAQRSEDASIAFTWSHFLNDPTSDSEYLLRLPMTKAGVRALDTIQAFLTSETAPVEIQELDAHPIQFFVAGASKRGWTTWTVGSVDPRVMAIVPVVMDLLNFVDNIQHHFKSYGGWSFALDDYWKLNITTYFGDPKIQEMMNIVDVYEYKEKLIMPKLVCDTSGDEFFLPDDTRYWWHDMPMEYEMNKFLTLPNSEHSTVTGILEILPAVNTWVKEILQAHNTLKNKYNGRRPEVKTIDERNKASVELMSVSNIPLFNWTIDNANGDITVQSEVNPKSVHLWHATTCNTQRKDFRLANNDDPCVCGVAVDGQCINLRVLWTAEELEETSPGSLTWVAQKTPPVDERWLAFFVDLQFDATSSTSNGWPAGEDGTLEFTTSISIVPDTFPYNECTGLGCLGILV